MFSKKYSKVYLYHLLNGFANSIISPFIIVFALFLGASNFDIILLSISITIVNIFLQAYLGFFKTIKNKTKTFIISKIGYSLCWLLMGFSFNVYFLILILSIQTLFSILSSFIWTNSFVANLPKYERLRVITRGGKYQSIGSLISNLIFGYLIANYGFKIHFFFLASSISLLSFLLFFVDSSLFFDKRSKIQRIKLREVIEDKQFLKFVGIRSFLNFAVTIISPFVVVFLVKNFNISTFELGILNSIGTLMGILVMEEWSLITIFDERIKVLFATLIPISLYPIIYLISPHWIIIAIWSIIGSIAWTGYGVLINSYFTFFINKRNSFTYSAIFNLSAHVTNIFSNATAGILLTFFPLPSLFVFSFFLRLFSIPMFLKLEGFPLSSIFSKDFKNVLKESLMVYEEIFSNIKSKFLQFFYFYPKIKLK